MVKSVKGKTAKPTKKAAPKKSAKANKSAAILETRVINLALQGGGSHGSYSWGVLNRLLDEERVKLDGISGASAGAMNAIALAQGFTAGGAEGAKASLTELWKNVSDMHVFSPVQRTPMDTMMGNWSLNNSPVYTALDLLSRVASPYQLNPLGFNPLRIMLQNLIDFKAVRACKSIKLFISATAVKTGRARVFKRNELTADIVTASACLPTLYQAIEIGGEAYWDGGYMGNPVLWPLIYHCDSRDIVIVQINPIERSEIPDTAAEIRNRIDEITFNSSLISEMRAINFVSKLINDGALSDKKYKKMLIHRIHSERQLNKYDASSKLNAEWDFLTELRDIGYHATDVWLKKNWSTLNVRSSLNVRDQYL